MLETPEITQAVDQQVAALPLTVPRQRIQEVMGPAIEELMTVLATQDITPTGPLLAYHLRVDPDVFDFEICVPVAAPVAPEGRVRPGRLPAATVARAVYHGPYEGLGAAWGELDAWIAAAGHAPRADLWECYLAGPESGSDPAAWRTELNRPLAG